MNTRYIPYPTGGITKFAVGLKKREPAANTAFYDHLRSLSKNAGVGRKNIFR